MRVAKAGAGYWAMVFVLGFVLGTARVLWLAPSIGPVAATVLELPVMLAASWFTAGWLVRRFGIGRGREALAMGGLAFALLMAAECGLAAILGQNPAQWLTGFRQPQAMLGLAGQVAFALLPWWRLRRSA